MWKNASPPPDYIITETKFGGAALDKSTGQMSDDWIERGIADLKDSDLKDSDLKDKLQEAVKTGNIEKRLLTVDRATGVVNSSVIK